jgi:cell division protein FtsW
VGLLPVTGVTLPLISAGGTSLVITLFTVGLLARFARAEPAAVEAERTRERGRISRWLLPVPSTPVDPVRLRRPDDPKPRRSTGGGGRTVVAARGAERRATPAERREAAPRRTPDRRPTGEGRRSTPPARRPGASR